MSELNPKTLLTCTEAAEYLSLSVSRIRYETFLKRIPHVKIGRTVRYLKTELDEWISALSRKGLGGDVR